MREGTLEEDMRYAMTSYHVRSKVQGPVGGGGARTS